MTDLVKKLRTAREFSIGISGSRPVSPLLSVAEIDTIIAALQPSGEMVLVPRATLELIYKVMNHMGDALNDMDAVTEEDVDLATPAFEAVRSLIAPSPSSKREG
jgi:hypothetical protein